MRKDSTTAAWLSPQSVVQHWQRTTQQATQQLLLGLLLLCPQPTLTAGEALALLQRQGERDGPTEPPAEALGQTLTQGFEALVALGWASTNRHGGYALTPQGFIQAKGVPPIEAETATEEAVKPPASRTNKAPVNASTNTAANALPPPGPAFLVREKKVAPKPAVVVPAVPPLPAPPQPPPLDADPLYQKLRALRGQLAQGEGVKLYHVCSNAVLRAMALQQPTHPSALEALPGVGPVFCTKYAPAFLELLVKHHLQ